MKRVIELDEGQDLSDLRMGDRINANLIFRNDGEDMYYVLKYRCGSFNGPLVTRWELVDMLVEAANFSRDV